MVQNVQRWVGEQMFQNREVVGRSFVISYKYGQNICQLSWECPQILRIVPYEIMTGQLIISSEQDGVRKMLMGAPKTKRMASVLTFFFRAIPQRWQ
jgi:hypothetical protein